jgi:hypothetical protein
LWHVYVHQASDGAPGFATIDKRDAYYHAFTFPQYLTAYSRETIRADNMNTRRSPRQSHICYASCRNRQAGLIMEMFLPALGTAIGGSPDCEVRGRHRAPFDRSQRTLRIIFYSFCGVTSCAWGSELVASERQQRRPSSRRILNVRKPVDSSTVDIAPPHTPTDRYWVAAVSAITQTGRRTPKSMLV